MIRLTSYNEVAVEFSAEEIRLIPFAADAFADEILDSNETYDIPAFFVNDVALQMLKRAVEAYLAAPGADFIPSPKTITTARFQIKSPPFVNLVWNTEPLNTFFHSLNEAEIETLVKVAGSMCMWNLREGAICLLLMRLFQGTYTFDRLLSEAWLIAGTIPYVYHKVMDKTMTDITSVDRNDYYAPRSSIHPE